MGLQNIKYGFVALILSQKYSNLIYTNVYTSTIHSASSNLVKDFWKEALPGRLHTGSGSFTAYPFIATTRLAQILCHVLWFTLQNSDCMLRSHPLPIPSLILFIFGTPWSWVFSTPACLSSQSWCLALRKGKFYRIISVIYFLQLIVGTKFQVQMISVTHQRFLD